MTDHEELLARLERDYKCVCMRRAGSDWQTIVDELGYSGTNDAYQRYVLFMGYHPMREEARR